MRVRISKSAVRGVASVPGSKSYTIRAALCAAMADGQSVIEGALESEDSSAVFECLRRLGVELLETTEGILMRGGSLCAADESLWCRESGATFRFVAALAATIPGRSTLRCAPSLARRPLQPLLYAIRQLGVECGFDADSCTLSIVGRRQRKGHVRLRADVSSQFLSALLLSGPRYEKGLRIDLPGPSVSERYVAMTVQCMHCFGVDVQVLEGGRRYVVPGGGYTPTRYHVEGDWSGAAAILALGALAGDVRVVGLDAGSLQADAAVLRLLDEMGAPVEADGSGVAVRCGRLEACTFDVSESIDLLPVACALAAVARGVSTFTGIARARDKESDRVAAMADGLSRLGVRVEVGDNEMSVWGGAPQGGVVSPAGDHRIAMAFGVLGAAIGDVVIEDAKCVSKTYPQFWQTVQSLGVEVRSDEQ